MVLVNKCNEILHLLTIISDNFKMENKFITAKYTLLIDIHNAVVFNSTWCIPVYYKSALTKLVTGLMFIYKTLLVVNTAFRSVSNST